LRLLHRAGQRLRTAGLDVNDNTPPRQMAELLRQSLHIDPVTLAALANWLLRMEACRYAATPAPRQLGTLEREFNRLPWPTAPRKATP
jgi:hypothetical protein